MSLFFQLALHVGEVSDQADAFEFAVLAQAGNHFERVDGVAVEIEDDATLFEVGAGEYQFIARK